MFQHQQVGHTTFFCAFDFMHRQYLSLSKKKNDQVDRVYK